MRFFTSHPENKIKHLIYDQFGPADIVSSMTYVDSIPMILKSSLQVRLGLSRPERGCSLQTLRAPSAPNLALVNLALEEAQMPRMDCPMCWDCSETLLDT